MGERRFDLGVMILKPTGVVRLESTDPSVSCRGGCACSWPAQRVGLLRSSWRSTEGRRLCAVVFKDSMW